MINMTEEPTHWGVSRNEEDWEVVSDFGLGMDQALEMVLDLEMGQGSKMGQDQEPFTIPIWIGPAARYSAAHFIERTLTDWDYMEERTQEMFHDESMCENDDAFVFPQGQKRTEWFAWMRKMSQKMCEKFDITINYYEIKSPERYDVTVWFVSADDDPRCEVEVKGVWYRSHPNEKSASEREDE